MAEAPVDENDGAMSLFLRARELIEVDRSRDAIPLLMRALSIDPRLMDARGELARAFLRLEAFGEALAAARDGAAMDPSNEWFHRLMSIALSRLGRRTAALEAAIEAVRLAPNAPPALNALAMAQLEKKKIVLARETADRLRELAPDEASTHRVCGCVSMAQTRWKEAQADFERALAIDPNDWGGMYQLGCALREQGKREEAIRCFHEAARINPTASFPKDSLLDMVRKHVGGFGFFLFALYFGSAFIFAWLADVTDNPIIAVGVPLVVSAIALGTFILLRRRRKSALHPTVVAFYNEEQRRERRRTWLGCLGGLAGVGAIAVLFRVFPNPDRDPRFWSTLVGAVLCAVVLARAIKARG